MEITGETRMKPGPYLIWGLLGAAAIVVAAVYMGQATSAATETLTDGSRINTSAILGGRQHNESVEEIVGGEVTAIMGGLDLDLRTATMSSDEVTLDIFVMMGGIKLRVPDDWLVVNDVGALMGGVQDRTRVPDAATGKRLVLRGSVLMGGLQVQN